MELYHAYNLFDSNKKGFINEDDLSRVFKSLWDIKFDLQEILRKMDYNNDGMVCFKGQKKYL